MQWHEMEEKKYILLMAPLVDVHLKSAGNCTRNNLFQVLQKLSHVESWVVSNRCATISSMENAEFHISDTGYFNCAPITVLLQNRRNELVRIFQATTFYSECCAAENRSGNYCTFQDYKAIH